MSFLVIVSYFISHTSNVEKYYMSLKGKRFGLGIKPKSDCHCLVLKGNRAYCSLYFTFQIDKPKKGVNVIPVKIFDKKPKLNEIVI